MVLVDYQAGLAFAAGSADRQGHSSCGVGAGQDGGGVLGAGGSQHVGEQGLQRPADAAATRRPNRRSTHRTP